MNGLSIAHNIGNHVFQLKFNESYQVQLGKQLENIKFEKIA